MHTRPPSANVRLPTPLPSTPSQRAPPRRAHRTASAARVACNARAPVRVITSQCASIPSGLSSCVRPRQQTACVLWSWWLTEASAPSLLLALNVLAVIHGAYYSAPSSTMPVVVTAVEQIANYTHPPEELIFSLSAATPDMPRIRETISLLWEDMLRFGPQSFLSLDGIHIDITKISSLFSRMSVCEVLIKFRCSSS
ncbi:hypothetical protein CERSUDRAFT_100922 [Gelatoporia subvermispora B]|uniref:Uncharacterized protein n=1 Tax=Ceriporiopsis subvermispora (strain B) TaxID=914234 RepID=M2P6G9_CERS8|nr:hypothetical protein CERSUDRAFT_100922 [Gelatoporia subvermispora B]